MMIRIRHGTLQYHKEGNGEAIFSRYTQHNIHPCFVVPRIKVQRSFPEFSF